MNTIEAHELVLEKIEDIKEYGVEVSLRESVHINDTEGNKEYLGPERIAPEKWGTYTFKNLDDSQIMRINIILNYLFSVGMYFDISGGKNERDWSIDWSFCYKGVEDSEGRRAANDVEKLLRDCDGK